MNSTYPIFLLQPRPGYLSIILGQVPDKKSKEFFIESVNYVFHSSTIKC